MSLVEQLQSEIDEHTNLLRRGHELRDEIENLRLELARREGRIALLREQIGEELAAASKEASVEGDSPE